METIRDPLNSLYRFIVDRALMFGSYNAPLYAGPSQLVEGNFPENTLRAE